MVNFALNDEQRAIQRLAHDFARREIRPVAHLYDEREEMPWEILQKAAKIGLTGGGGLPLDDDGLSSFLITEELNWGCAGIATAILSSHMAALVIALMGTSEQKARFLPKCLSSEDQVRLGAVAITEPEAGSDVASISTTAKRENDEYILNGTKCFVTNGGIADLHLVFATEERSLGWGGIAAFVVEKGTPGLRMGRKERKLGIRASHTAEVILEDVRIPLENRLGLPKEKREKRASKAGAQGVLSLFELSRPIVGIAAVGVARAAFEYALDYAKSRIQFGRPIASHQAIAFKLADMAIEIDAARLLCWRAGWMIKQGEPLLRGEGSMAKCFAGDLAMRVTTEAVQILGGHGYMRDHPVEKWMRDAKIFQIFEGTSEIQRQVIARSLVGDL